MNIHYLLSRRVVSGGTLRGRGFGRGALHYRVARGMPGKGFLDWGCGLACRHAGVLAEGLHGADSPRWAESCCQVLPENLVKILG